MNRIDMPGNNLFLGYVYRPYTANTASLRLMYLWQTGKGDAARFPKSSEVSGRLEERIDSRAV